MANQKDVIKNLLEHGFCPDKLINEGYCNRKFNPQLVFETITQLNNSPREI